MYKMDNNRYTVLSSVSNNHGSSNHGFCYNWHMDLTDRRLKLTKNRIEACHTLGLFDTTQLLHYYPYRYEILETKPISSWQEKDRVCFEGKLVSAVHTWRFGRSRTGAKFDVMVDDHIVHITIFNRPWAKQLKEDDILTITGIYQGKGNVTAMNYQAKPLSALPKVMPIYSLKEGIQQRTIRDSIQKVYELEKDTITSFIPESIKEKYQLLDETEALRCIHFPNSQQDISQAYRTLKYEEFLRFFLAVQIMKQNRQGEQSKEEKHFDMEQIKEFIAQQPFVPTPDQDKAIQDILHDLQKKELMYRLVQGDVGCGKTFVAMVGLYASVLAGYQGALLAPTEILARQHYENMKEIYQPYKVRLSLLYSGLSNQEKEEIIEKLVNHEIDIVIGTHALIQENVTFARLGLVIVDEQQRFGVAQRRALKEKGEKVDFLLMSATPIPRTLASSLYGDMDVSTIETMPAGRKPVMTTLVKENSFRSVLDEIQDILAEGHQLYVICAAIDENEDYDARDVFATTDALKKLFAGQYEVACLHGKMSSSEKQAIMEAFYTNQIQVLVSTTVVEVGMNVVNATGMIIYDADRFGMSQIHQLRGRIQRGSAQGRCYLLTDSSDPHTLERLEILTNTSNGFEISYEDLRLRGPGDILGTRQSGVPDFVLGNIIEDVKIIDVARKDAQMIYDNPDKDEYKPLLRDVIRENERNSTIVD